MRKSNSNLHISYFLIGFGLVYILLNASKWTNEQNSESDIATIYNKMFTTVELRQNSSSKNFAKIPSYKKVGILSSIGAQTGNYESENKGNFTANYALNNDNEYAANKFEIETTTNNYVPSIFYDTYSTHKNLNDMQNNEYSDISLAISKLTSSKSEVSTIIEQAASNKTKSEHGFLAMNSDLKAINSSIGITENSMQKSTNDEIPPGDGDLGDPIPVGDGWLLLSTMALIYGGYKYLMRLKTKSC